MFGLSVTVIGGDHNFNALGKYIFDVEKRLINNDLPVVIEEDVWVGTNLAVLKGIIVRSGSIISADAVFNNNVPRVSIFEGLPAKLLKLRILLNVYSEHLKAVDNA